MNDEENYINKIQKSISSYKEKVDEIQQKIENIIEKKEKYAIYGYPIKKKDGDWEMLIGKTKENLPIKGLLIFNFNLDYFVKPTMVSVDTLNPLFGKKNIQKEIVVFKSPEIKQKLQKFLNQNYIKEIFELF